MGPSSPRRRRALAIRLEKFHISKQPCISLLLLGASSTLIFGVPVVPWAPCLVVCEQSRFLFFTTKRTSSGLIVTCMLRMRTFLCVFAVQSTCSRRIFDFKTKCISVFKFIMSKYILFVAGSIHPGHERFIDIIISWRGQCSFSEFFSVVTCPEFAD